MFELEINHVYLNIIWKRPGILGDPSGGRPE